MSYYDSSDKPEPVNCSLSSPVTEPLDCASHKARFLGYARSFRTGDPLHDQHLKIKKRHTFGVVQYARRIADAESCFAPPAMRRALLLAALYHDIARFPQYARYQTFSDARSFNHGQFGCRELLRQGILATETKEIQAWVRSAVLLHNRFSLPRHLPDEPLRITQAVRDADKLDILRVMRENLGAGATPDPVIVLHMPDSPEYSPAILDAVRQRRLASFVDMRSTTDLRLLLCGWFYDLNFQASKALAVRSGHLLSIVESLPDTPDLNSFAREYRRDLAK